MSPDGNCLNCRQPVTDVPNPFAENPYESPNAGGTARIHGDGLTIGEKIYSAMVILCAGFLLASVGVFHFIVIPTTNEPAILFVVSIMWMYVVALAATTIINLYYRSLLIIPTIVQCAVLGLAVYFIPFAVWGGVLLYRRLQRAKSAG